MRLLLLFLTAALGAALPTPRLLAQSKPTLRKPPIVVATNVSVWRGEQAVITLRGFQANNPVEYVIDRPPLHGSLSGIAQPDPDRVSISTDGSVSYVHDNSDESKSDEFTFRAHAVRGGGISAPAIVRIDIRDRPPVLASPPVLDFQAAAGESMTRSLGLTNTGGGILRIDCRANPPFEILGAEAIDLPRGTSTNVLVRYTPKLAGETAREIIRPGINDSSGAQIVLRGESRAPFEVEVAGNEFILEGKARLSSVTVISRATQAQEVTITTEPAGLVVTPEPLRLEPGASQPVPLRIPSERKGERQDVTVTFATPLHRREIALVAPPVPADLDLGDDQLDFTEKQIATVTVKNTGGVTGKFRLLPIGGLAFAEGGSIDAREFQVEADSETNVEFLLDLPAGAQPPGELLVDLGKTELRRIAILAPTPKPTLPPAPTPTPTPVPTPPPQTHPWELNTDVRLVERRDDEKLLEWRTSVGNWREPQLEVFRRGRWLAPESGLIQRFGDWLSGFFRGLVRAPDWTATSIDAEAATDDVRFWRLTAHRENANHRQPVSQEFTIDWNRKTLIEREPITQSPESPEIPGANPPTPAPTGTLSAGGHTLKIASATAEARRDSAKVQVIFVRDPEADSYRLEHGSYPTSQDPDTGLLRVGRFRAHPHPSATATILGTAGTHLEGRELTVLVAMIEGLKPGTSTTWRVVAMSGNKDLGTTGEFMVSTLPPWQFPWRQAVLVVAFVGLAGLLYLRWHGTRVPG